MCVCLNVCICIDVFMNRCRDVWTSMFACMYAQGCMHMCMSDYEYMNLLPTRSEERGILLVGSIPVAIPFSC